ncbi:MAG: translocation/assembly module TamB domain-containing protein [Cyclobacteriaceae bacterium]
MTHFAVDKLNELSSSRVVFDNIKIDWFDNLSLSGLKVFDYNNNILFASKTVTVDFNVTKIIRKTQISFDEVLIDSAEFNLLKYRDSLDINLVKFIAELKGGLNKTQRSKASRAIKVDHIALANCIFRYDNRLKDSLEQIRFDQGHITWKLKEAEFSDFSLMNDSLILNILNFEGYDSISKLEIKNLRSKLTVFPKGIFFDSLLLETGQSIVKNQIHLNFDQISDINYFIDKVDITAEFTDTHFNTEELKYFVNGKCYKYETHFSGKLAGKISDFKVEDLALNVRNSSMKGDFSLNGLPDLDETFIQLDLKQSHIEKEDFDEWLPKSFTNKIDIAKVDIKGSLVGFLYDFVSYANIKTSYGDLKMDLNLKIPSDLARSRYSGSLGATNFRIGALFGESDLLDKVSFESKVKGAGLDLNYAKVDLNAIVTSFDFNNYQLDSLYLDGKFRDKFFSGNVKLRDVAAAMDGTLLLNLNETPEVFSAEISIDTVDFQLLGLSDRKIVLSSQLKVNTEGIILDSLQGKVDMKKFVLKSSEDTLKLDSVELKVANAESVKTIQLVLPEIDLSIKGDFIYGKLIEDFTGFIASIKNKIIYNDTLNGQNIEVPDDNSTYSADLVLTYEHLDDYLAFFNLPLFFSPYGKVESRFDKRSGFNFDLLADFDSMHYQGISLIDVNIDANISRAIDRNENLANVILKSSRQSYANIPETEKMFIEAVWLDQELKIYTRLKQPSTLSSVDLESTMIFDKVNAKVALENAEVILLDKKWTINPFNSILVNRKGLAFDRVEIYNNTESISLNGIYKYDSLKKYSIELIDLEMNILGLISEHEYQGAISNLFEYESFNEDSVIFSSTTKVENLWVDNIQIGNISGDTKFSNDSSLVKLRYDVIRDSESKIHLSGNYHLDNRESPVDLDLKFNNTKIDFISPFLENVFSGINGRADGQIDIGGKITSPNFQGDISVTEARLKVDYLNVGYNFEGDIRMENDNLTFNDFRISDREGNRGLLRGNIALNDYKRPIIDIDVNVNNLLVLNTSRNNNQMYYGTAYGTGTVSVQGPTNDISIKSKATTNKGTKIFIPLSTRSEVATKEYISFVDLVKNTNEQRRINDIINNNLSGVSFDLDLSVTNDAYVELIFDIRTGDIIRGRANGDLNMKLDTDGEFDLFGGVTITEGAYNFTIPNLINKEFNILPGSTISWYGDPYSGNLDLDATYRQIATLGDFLNTGETDVNNRIPFLVKLQLDGDMLSPNINFSIDFDQSLSNITIRDEEVLSALNENEQELKRQVFSLLILKKLSPQNTFAVGGEAFGSSVSEFLSNQFSYFLSQVDENLEFDFDIGSLDQNAFNTFQLRLSYTFLDGRLKVTGGAQTEINETSNQFLGDWSVRYSLTEDGQLRVRVFSQNEQIIDEWQRETGLSIQFVKSFDDLKELLSKASKKAKVQ